jgi:hypothetical protein
VKNRFADQAGAADLCGSGNLVKFLSALIRHIRLIRESIFFHWLKPLAWSAHQRDGKRNARNEIQQWTKEGHHDDSQKFRNGFDLHGSQFERNGPTR